MWLNEILRIRLVAPRYGRGHVRWLKSIPVLMLLRNRPTSELLRQCTQVFTLYLHLVLLHPTAILVHHKSHLALLIPKN
jgi:hypothetical protein